MIVLFGFWFVFLEFRLCIFVEGGCWVGDLLWCASAVLA